MKQKNDYGWYWAGVMLAIGLLIVCSVAEGDRPTTIWESLKEPLLPLCGSLGSWFTVGILVGLWALKLLAGLTVG